MELNVVYSSDNNYCRHLMVSFLSLLDNNQDFDELNVFVVENQIDESNKQWMLEKASRYGANLKFIDYKNIESFIKTDGKFPVSAFVRLFLQDIIEKDIVIYMDCDSVINGSFKNLVQEEWEDYICFAVQDNVSKYFKTSIGMKKDDVYFNSGFEVINLRKWREAGIQDKAVAVIKKFNGSVPHHDQGVLNAVCYGKIKRVHPKYNFQCPMFEYTPKQLRKMIPNYYSEAEIKEAIANPVFIHFTEGFSGRPWKKVSTHPMREIYRKYQAQTPWAGQLNDEGVNSHAKVFYNVYKHTPFPVYRAFCKAVELIKER